MKQGKSEVFDSSDRPSNLTQTGFKSSIFQLVWPWNLMVDLEKHQGTTSIQRQVLYIISNPLVNSYWSYSPETLKSGQNWRFFVLCDLETWWMTLENHRTPPPYYVKLCASFQSHAWIQTGVTVRKRSIRVKIGHFLVPCDLEIWQMTLNNNMAPMLLQALGIIWKPSVNLNSRETLDAGQNQQFLSRHCDGLNHHRAAWSQLKRHPISRPWE